QRPYANLTLTWRATYSQRKPLLGGSQVAASPAPFDWLSGPEAARRLSGSLPKACSFFSGHDCAPFCQASAMATTWSICTSLDVPHPRSNLISSPEYGSISTPDSTTQS